MKFRKALVWSIATENQHPSLTDEEKTIEGVMPLVQALFPGMNYFSITGFGQVMVQCLIPALRKQFPELGSVSADDIKSADEVEVQQLLPSEGYEWQDSPEWTTRFTELMAA